MKLWWIASPKEERNQAIWVEFMLTGHVKYSIMAFYFEHFTLHPSQIHHKSGPLLRLVCNKHTLSVYRGLRNIWTNRSCSWLLPIYTMYRSASPNLILNSAKMAMTGNTLCSVARSYPFLSSLCCFLLSQLCANLPGISTFGQQKGKALLPMAEVQLETWDLCLSTARWTTRQKAVKFRSWRRKSGRPCLKQLLKHFRNSPHPMWKLIKDTGPWIVFGSRILVVRMKTRSQSLIQHKLLESS